MRSLRLKWSTNNAKLKKLDTASFSLPAFRSADGFKVCPKAGGCASLCYARQGRYVIPGVQASREYNLRIIRDSVERFTAYAIEDLRQIRQRTIRVHDSGDFFSQAYLDSWFTIARQFPEKRFYAYTKSLHLDRSQCPENFQLVQSAGGQLDDAIDLRQSHSRIFATVADRRRAGYVDGNRNDGPAIKGVQKIGLVYHGTSKLKAGQIQWLRSI